MLRIGIDFDNTIVDYRRAFASAVGGAETAKVDVRDALRARPGGEAEWQRLQAHVYGIAIAQAPPFEGFEAFVRAARERGAALYIVSHKTRYAAAAPDGPDLHEAARAWLFSRGIGVDGLYFEVTRADKLARIAALQLTHFIDDLDEVLSDPAFPAGVRGIHFRDSWEAVQQDVFG